MSNLKNILLSRDITVPSDFEVFKDIYRHFKGKSVKAEGGTIPGDGRPLLSKPEEFFLVPPSDGFLQGDIIANIPAAWLAKDTGEEEGNQISAFLSENRMGMIISNECDAEKRTENSQAYIRLCPVYKESELLQINGLIAKEAEAKKSDFLGKLKNNRYTEYFWMPNYEKEEESLIADLGG